MKIKMSLKWQLTLMTACLVTLSCLLLSLCISKTAVFYMDELGDAVVTVFPKEAISQNINTNEDFYLEFSGNLTGIVQASQSSFWMKSIIATLIMVLVSSCLTYFIVGYALKPLNQLSTQVNNIREKNLTKAVTVDNAPEEIVSLSNSFNAMLKRIAEAFNVQRRFSANAAHELRTPLAIMQTNLDVFRKQTSPSIEDYEDVLHMVDHQTTRLSHVISVLLQMGEVETLEKKQSVSLAEVCEEAICDLTPLAQKKNVSLIQKEGDAYIVACDTLIYRALFNLIENAIKYNRENGKVIISIHTEEPYAVIEIEDNGKGIPEEDCTKIFEPFFRVDKSRSRAMGGAGLGLALVKEIALKHGGDVRVIKSSPEGSLLEIRFLLR